MEVALAAVAGRWATLVLRELMHGPAPRTGNCASGLRPDDCGPQFQRQQCEDSNIILEAAARQNKEAARQLSERNARAKQAERDAKCHELCRTLGYDSDDSPGMQRLQKSLASRDNYKNKDRHTGYHGEANPIELVKSAWNHVYVSFSMCLMGCMNFSVQAGTVSMYVTGGATVPTIKDKPSPFRFRGGAFAGFSAGWNTAGPKDSAKTVGGVTYADGLMGGAYSLEKNPNGQYFHQFGWAAGPGAIQGPPLIGIHANIFKSDYGWDYVNEND
ncbi:hypothetical protein [Streptomyces sp. CBMA156]|uniref:hypothetical protein n=1 Tax=Streptomyces sp. CBMA156 TaxID=1930280 RepID=UPI001CB83A98|nr:hypothetical protein [Streptomyces sp. CBMA156]